MVKALVVNVALLLPTSAAPIFHWYEGVVPGLVGVAVNVTDDPEQIVVPEPLTILTLGVTDGLTVIVRLFEVAVVGIAQAELEVNTQETT